MKKESAKFRLRIKKFNSKHSENEAGITLALVVAAGLVLTIGAMVLSARSFKNLAGSIRLDQSREARKIAESGMAKILDNLNKNYPYLLIENCEVVNNSPPELLDSPECSGWQEVGSGVSVKGTFEQRGAVCPAAKLPASSIMSSLYELDTGYTPTSDIIGKYRLIDYQFIGDAYQGGVATIKVQGQRISNDGSNQTITASAMIEKEVTIAPKCCDGAPYSNLERCAASRIGANPECDQQSDSDKHDNNKDITSNSGDITTNSGDISSNSSDISSVSSGINANSDKYPNSSNKHSDSHYQHPDSSHQHPNGSDKHSDSSDQYPDSSEKDSDNSSKGSNSSDRRSDSSDKHADSDKNSDREICENKEEVVIREFAAIGTNKWNLIQLKD